MDSLQATQSVLRQYWDLSLPVNPVKIASVLGINVFYSSGLGDLGGYYDQETQSIYINDKDPITRQRFSIAHELGHALLGHGSSPRRNDISYTKWNYIQKENAANRFAAALLMPDLAVRTLIEQKEHAFE